MEDVAGAIAVFAKSLSNDFPMAAIVGTRAVMQAAQDSFISSSFWTEAIGPAAALEAIRKMIRINVSAKANAAGAAAQAVWRTLADKHDLDITLSRWPALTTFTLNYSSYFSVGTTMPCRMRFCAKSKIANVGTAATTNTTVAHRGFAFCSDKLAPGPDALVSSGTT